MKKITLLLMFFAFIQLANAQGYEKGSITVGPAFGLGWGSLGFGVQGEYGVTENIAAGGEIGFLGFSEKYTYWGGWYQYKYSLTSVLFTGSYHFKPEDKFDPYAKVGLGFFNWRAKYTSSNGSTTSWATPGYDSGIGYAIKVGARYYFTDQIAGRAELGYPYILSIGADFKF